MTQSGFLAAALLAGLVLFLAAKGRLSAYTDVLFGPAPDVTKEPFGGIPRVTVGGPAAPKGDGGGGGGLFGLPKLGAATGNAAANDNWLSGLESGLGDLAASAAEAAVL